MFNLVRHFSIVSLIALLGMMIVLATVYRQITIDELVDIQESENAALTQVFVNSIWPDFEGFLTSNSETSADDMGPSRHGSVAGRRCRPHGRPGGS